MILIAILTGIILGQYIRLDVDSKAIDFARSAWTTIKGLDIKGAIEYARMGPLQRQVYDTFKQLDAEAIAPTETTDKAPKAIAARLPSKARN
jgi:hypothetical protein